MVSPGLSARHLWCIDESQLSPGFIAETLSSGERDEASSETGVPREPIR